MCLPTVNEGLQEEDAVEDDRDVGFDLDEAPKYLEGLDYPADKEKVLSTAERNGAPGALIETIEGLPLGEFSELEEFMNHLRAVPNRDN